MHKKFIFIIPFLFLFLAVSAQEVTEPLVIDVAAGKYPRSLPFDRPFQIRYTPEKKIAIKYVGLFQVGRDGCFQRMGSLKCIKAKIRNDKTLKTKKDRDSALKKELDVIPSETLYYDMQDTSTKGVKFDMPALKPNKRYTLVFMSFKRIEGIQAIVDTMRVDTMKARIMYEQLQRDNTYHLSLNKNAGCGKCEKDFTIDSFHVFEPFYYKQLKTLEDSIKKVEGLLKGLLSSKPVPGKISIDPVKIDTGLIRAIVNHSQQCPACKDSIWQQEWSVTGKIDALTPLLRLTALSKDTGITFGYHDIYTIPLVPNTNVNYATRLKNLSTTITGLEKLLILMDYFHARHAYHERRYAGLRDEIQDAIDTLKKNAAIFAELAKTETGYKDSIAKIKHLSDSLQQYSEIFFSPSSSFHSDSYTYNFETRADFLLKPDFGFMYYGSLNKRSSFNGFAAYLGFHINFRPLDTNIPFGAIGNEGVLGHLSFNGGALIGSFAEAGKRDGLIGNTAIFTGLGWAFTDWLRLTSGALWYRKEEVNPLKSRKTTAAVPYISLSIDFRLKGIYESFAGIF
ncbi:hypothetical protein AAHN97_12400 [Chitinophaga niabensis]|uniref:hypothetical protein n=1 Tax=Chitinophaga niabensis TaxID=536979 RepID=UPI0031BABD21